MMKFSYQDGPTSLKNIITERREAHHA